MLGQTAYLDASFQPVTVEDRGPHVGSRVLDVTPKVADELDMKKTGVTPVVISPIEPDGVVKLGAGAVEVTTRELRMAPPTANASR